MTINYFINIVKKKIHLLILFPIIFGIGAAIFAWGFMTNDYTSSVAIYVLNHREYQNAPGYLNSNDVATSQQLSNDIAVLAKTNRVTNAVCDELGIEDLKGYSVGVSSNEKNRVINISVTGKNPNSTAQVCNSIARQTATLAVEVMKAEAVNIIEEAYPSDNPSGPHRMLITLISLFAGIFLALVVIVLDDMLDTTVKNSNDLKELVNIPILAQVPYIKKLK
ncbi:MAG: Wzz/FepE/Etk N-terminal domain-containing protein [Coriobacteriia bacterium]|nr:Wzz/FepE/Etk N-terminal domain-containing protein [Coriobacteriia bacterium]